MIQGLGSFTTVCFVLSEQMMSIGTTSEMSVKISESDVKGLTASIISPSGIEEPCFLRKIDTDDIGNCCSIGLLLIMIYIQEYHLHRVKLVNI